MYDIGEIVRVTVTFSDTGGTPADPTTIKFYKKGPHVGAVSSTYTWSTGSTTLVRDALGVFYTDILTTGSGDYHWRWAGTGAVIATTQGGFSVRKNLA